MENHPKTWTHQPDQVIDAPVCVIINCWRDAMIEVRKTAEGRYLVTVGNLFGSETVDCGTDADLVFELMHKFNRGKLQVLPSGATVIA